MNIRLISTTGGLLLGFAAAGQSLPLRVGAPTVEKRAGRFDAGAVEKAKTDLLKTKTGWKGRELDKAAHEQVRAQAEAARKEKRTAYARSLLARQQDQLGKADALQKKVERIFLEKRKKLLADTTLAPAEYSALLLALEAEEADQTRQQQPYLDAAEYYAYRYTTRGHGYLFPVRSRQHTPLYFESQSLGRDAEFLTKAQTAINPSTGKLSLYNELFADYVGWFRLGLGTTIVGSNQGQASTPQEQRNENAVQRFVGGGGNGLLTVAYPVLALNSTDGVAGLRLTSLGKLASDLPQTGSSSGDFAYHSNLGVSLFGYYTGSKNVLTPFFYFHYGESWGNGIFYDNLGRNEHSSVSLNQLSSQAKVTVYSLPIRLRMYWSRWCRVSREQ